MLSYLYLYQTWKLNSDETNLLLNSPIDLLSSIRDIYFIICCAISRRYRVKVLVTVAESLNRDHSNVREWCDLLGMELNDSITKTLIVSRSRTMHLQSLPLTILAELCCVEVTFDFKMTFVEHLHSVSRAVYLWLIILRMSYSEYSTIGCFLGDAFGGLSFPFLSTLLQLWCSAPETHLKLQNRVVMVPVFNFGGVECDYAHRRSVAVLCMLYTIRYTHPLYGTLPGPYVPVPITRGASVAHRYTNAPTSCGTSQYTAELLFPSHCLCGTILPTLYSMVWVLSVSTVAGPMFFYWPKLLAPFLSSTVFHFSSFFQ